KATGAETEGDGVDVPDVDAGELGAELLLGNRADCLTRVGKAQDEPEDQRYDEHDAEADDARQREESDAEVDDVEGIVEVERAGIGTKGIKQHVLDHHREPERHQQNIAVLAVRGRADDEALQAITSAKNSGVSTMAAR